MQTNPTYYKPETPSEWYDRICRNQQARIKQAPDMETYHQLKQIHDQFKSAWAYATQLAQAMEKVA